MVGASLNTLYVFTYVGRGPIIEITKMLRHLRLVFSTTEKEDIHMEQNYVIFTQIVFPVV